MKKQVAIIILITLTVVGCSTTKRSKGQMTENNNAVTAITDTTWELTKLEGTMIDQSTISGKKIHFKLNSEDQTINGYAGCNVFNGTYTLEKGNRIHFSKMATTRMACPDATLDENAVLKVFELADNYTITGGVLALNIGRRASLALFKNSKTDTEPITEKYWKLKTLEGQEVKMAENQEREIYFMLKNQENRVTGFSGCNTFSGSYILEEGNRIRFSNMASTLKACPDVAVDESAFLKVFELTDNYTINGDTLSLNVGRRSPLAVFEAVYFE